MSGGGFYQRGSVLGARMTYNTLVHMTHWCLQVEVSTFIFQSKSRTLMIRPWPSLVLWLRMDSSKQGGPAPCHSCDGAVYALLSGQLLTEITTTPCSLEMHHKLWQTQLLRDRYFTRPSIELGNFQLLLGHGARCLDLTL